ncbi:MAG TPA: tetratricopeptide repeat protein [Pyrinomonadaceae bacterium]|nr:tetratricopeptide repeat protein [Pyrinomonadaceae bacterium]
MRHPLSIRRSAFGVSLLLFVLIAPLTVQAKDNWLRVHTKNFTLVGNAGEKDLRQVATKLEQFRDVFTRLFGGARFTSPVPTTVLVFKSKSSYKPFAVPNAAGYFQKGEDVNYITLSTETYGDNPLSIIYHEYVHLLIDNTVGNVPSWFNEGLAEYYGAFAIEEDRKVHLGDLIPYHLMTLREEKLLPLRKLFAVDHYSPEYNERDKRGIFYAQSWALVHYLMLANNAERRAQLSTFIELVGSNVAIEEAFKRAFQTDIETMEKELKKYIAGHTFKMQVATFQRKLEFDSEFTVTPLTEADAQAYLGDLLLHLNRLSDADTRLQQALALDAKQPMALASLGILRARQGRFDEARKTLQEAVAGNSSNYLAHYYYAFALSREGMDTNNIVRGYSAETASLMRTELTKAIDLNPNFPESYSLLAFINTVTGEDLEKSIELLQRALKLSPGRQDLALLVAQIHMRQEKFDLAKQVLAPLQNAKDRRLKAQSEALLKTIQDYENAVSRFKSDTTPGNPRLRPQTNAAEASEEPPSKPPSEHDYLRETLRAAEAGEERIQGLFVKLECDNRAVAYFIIQVGDRLYKIRATALDRVQLISYVPGASEVGCGVRKNKENVIITFRPAADPKDVRAKIHGDAIAMEMVPKDFKLNPN